MDIKTETFGTITAKAFAVAGTYIKRAAARIKHEFEVIMIYGVGAVLKTGDATHINKYLSALTLAGLEAKFRKVVVNHNIIPFAYDNKTCQYVGKINGPRRADLVMIVNGVPQWEILLAAALDGAKPENNTKPFVTEVKLATFVKGLRGLDIQPTDAQVVAMLKTALKDNPMTAPESTSISADNAKAIKDNAIAHAEQVKVTLNNGAALAA